MVLAHTGKGKKGSSLRDVAAVQGNGNRQVDKANTAMLDLKPGNAFEIRLDRYRFRVSPVGGRYEA